MIRECYIYTTLIIKSKSKFDAELLLAYPPKAFGIVSVATELRS